MQMTETVKTSTQRITVIDAMRGIALIGICLTHAMQYFGAFPPAPIETPFPWIGTLDEMFSWLIRYLVFAKFYIIFSFLFGLSFFIQMDRAAQKGIDFRPRFLWRLTLLLIIGYLHSLIFHMDILIIYAIVGFPLVLLYKVPNKVLVGLALFFLLGGVSLGVNLYKAATEPPRTEIVAQNRPRPAVDRPRPDLSLTATIQNNSADRLVRKFNFQHNSGRIYMTLGLFILGLWAGRIRLFHNLEQDRTRLYRYAGIGLAALLLLYAIQPYLPGRDAGVLAGWLAMPVENMINLLSAYLWITLIVFLYKKPQVEKTLAPVVSYGRMGLTNYILQSVIGVFLYYRFGLGLNQYLGPFLGMMLCLGYTFIQIYLSHYWLKTFRYGPLEWLWRSGTYMKWQPLRKLALQ